MSSGEIMTPAQEYRLGVRAAVLIIAWLCGLCVLASIYARAGRGPERAAKTEPVEIKVGHAYGDLATV